ncbi:MAG TPA: prolyl oligopeptidase family serine peptidase [Candidatus Polarisedimenticolia bacterium]|nr:prolyl oligopeptidase family serine peptidase [Candidatus Polarisedimenticolia bacterium]
MTASRPGPIGRISLLMLLLAAAGGLAAAGARAASPKPEVKPPVAAKIPPPPVTRRDDVKETLHGVTIVDPYRWLEDQNAPETRAWIDAQNTYAHALLDPLPMRGAIRERLTALARQDTQWAPTERAGRYFIQRRRAGDDLPALFVRDGIDGREAVLLDPAPLSPDHTTSVSIEDLSMDGGTLAYGVRTGGEDETELRLRDTRTLQDLPDRLPRALYRGVSLRPDGKGFYYARQDRKTGIRIRYHAVGTPIEKDTEVFGAGFGPSAWVGATVSDNGRHLLFSVAHGWASSEVHAAPLDPPGPARPVVTGLDAHVQAAFAGDRLIAQTDWQAPTGRIVEIDPDHPEPAHWRDIVPAGPDAIEGMALVGGRVIVHTLHDVAARLDVYALDGRREGGIALPGPGTVANLTGRFDSDEIFFDFQSYTTPPSTLRASVASRTTTSFWRASIPFEPDRYETQQVWFDSKDGTKVPMFVVHRKGLALDGRAPALLYGYGGFAVSITPAFSATTAWWLEQGGVYAVANIRGGSEFGEAWHKAGMLRNKQNVFDDFIAAARWLPANRYTSRERLAIRGASNGGLLMGAVMTQQPGLFRAVLCEFPDLDMLGFWRFPNNNPPALLEYGDASKPDQFKYLQAYSPYQKVTPGTAYPAVLFMTGDADTRVPPLQARKMTARMQAASTSGRPVLLLYDTKAGHAGGQPLGKMVENQSLEMAFLAWQLGMK